jgi:hypothetical protein
MTFIHGCNYPWSADGTTIFYGLDFGANVWGSHLGVSTRRAAVARDFADIAALGFTAVRWFVFCDGRSGIVYDEGGLPSGLDPHFFPDMDAALEIARDAGVRIDFVLLDHRWMFEGVRDTIADPATGALLEARLPQGRSRVLRADAGRAALVRRVFLPLVRRYGPSGERADLAGSVLAYELMNEPDFVIDEWELDVSSHVARPLPFEAVAELVASLSDIVHEYSTALATIGCARLRNLWAWDDDAMGLDVLQVHSYPDVQRPEADPDLFGMLPSELGVRRAVILGEFPGNAPEQHPPDASPPATTLEQYLEFAVSHGYAGAWPWSFSGTDAYGRLPIEPLRRFATRHPELVHPAAHMKGAGDEGSSLVIRDF